jgi:hypothetical protein
MNQVLRQEIFGGRPIRDAASGKIATITRDRNMNFRGTTKPVAAMGEWEDTFKNITGGLSGLTNSIGNLIGSIKGNTTIVNPNTGGFPMQGMYYGQQPYYGVNPMIPSYNYPVQQQVIPRTTTTNNTLLYTGLGVAALAGLIFLRK